jgi:hypothetical protein
MLLVWPPQLLSSARPRNRLCLLLRRRRSSFTVLVKASEQHVGCKSITEHCEGFCQMGSVTDTVTCRLKLKSTTALLNSTEQLIAAVLQAQSSRLQHAALATSATHVWHIQPSRASTRAVCAQHNNYLSKSAMLHVKLGDGCYACFLSCIQPCCWRVLRVIGELLRIRSAAKSTMPHARD